MSCMSACLLVHFLASLGQIDVVALVEGLVEVLVDGPGAVDPVLVDVGHDHLPADLPPDRRGLILRPRVRHLSLI